VSGKSHPQPISVTIPAIPSSIGPLRRQAGSFASASGACREHVADISLAVSEAVTNVVKYAYGPDGKGVVELSAEVAEDGALEIGIGDQGRWHEGESSGLGFGLPLIARLSDGVRISQDNSGTVVQMRFALS
jgi:anti-sigma regulatory factor (Ser/Thr protein kinase)